MGHIGWMILLVCVLSGATLFFSLSIFSLRIFSRTKLRQVLKATGRYTDVDIIVDKIAKNSDRLIRACALYRLILNVCTPLVLVAVFSFLRGDGPVLDDYFISFLITVIIFSLFSLAIPHAWAKYAGERILSRTYALLLLFAGLVSPMLYLRELVDRFIRRLAGIADATPGQQREKKQDQFLDELIEQRKEGVVDEEQQEMIEGVLELSETTAENIMTPRTNIIAIEVSSDLNAVVYSITAAGHTRVPVYEGDVDNIIGFVYAKDLLGQIGKAAGRFQLRDKMRPAYFVPETKPLKVLLHEFQSRKLHIAVVVDEYGGTAGIVTLEDILEELVGEIADEYEKSVPGLIKKVGPDTIEVNARMYVKELNDEFELGIPEDEDYDTVAGFVLSHLGYIPQNGASFEYDKLHFTVISAEPRRIKGIRIRKSSVPNVD